MKNDAPSGVPQASPERRSDWFDASTVGPAGGASADISAGWEADLDSWIEMHRRRMEMLAALRSATGRAADAETLRLRQAANRLYIETDRVGRRISSRYKPQAE
jgi:hypothetical protein